MIDAGPDFRYQMLRTGVRHIDAILLTHEHKDHIGGLDDVRASILSIIPRSIGSTYSEHGRRSNASARTSTMPSVWTSIGGVPEIELREIDPAVPFCVKDKEVIPVSGHHSARFEVTGSGSANWPTLRISRPSPRPKSGSCTVSKCWWSMRSGPSPMIRIFHWTKHWR